MKTKLKKKTILNIREQKYCRCLIHVRSSKLSPYGICTNSVYSLQKKKRKRVVPCSKNYDFNSFTAEELRLYAKEKKIKTRKNNRYIKKKKLIESIKKNLTANIDEY
jgi:hypothetical protein